VKRQHHRHILFHFLGAGLVCGSILACQPYGEVVVTPPGRSIEAPPVEKAPGKIDAIPRYGGTVLTAQAMPSERSSAYLWAKHMNTLVSCETFLRKYSDGPDAAFIRQQIRTTFAPPDAEWQDAWQLYSKLEIIDGAICDPDEGLILLGRAGAGRMPPFLYDDLVTALKCCLTHDKIGVTMTRVFKARYKQADDPREVPYDAYETSVEFFSRKLWNTHLAFLLFEGDRMLKSLGAGYDIFHREPVKASVPGFATIVEMASREVAEEEYDEPSGKYGRIWIELTTVNINTTDNRNVAMFSDVKLEVRAESKHEPPNKFAKHIRENYDAYAAEFPIFGEVERAARIVAIARWLADTYPDVSTKLVNQAYEQVAVQVPQVIDARYDRTHKTPHGESGLIGGVVFPPINRYRTAPDEKVSDTELAKVPQEVINSRPGSAKLAWEVSLGKGETGKYIAWDVSKAKEAALHIHNHGSRLASR